MATSLLTVLMLAVSFQTSVQARVVDIPNLYILHLDPISILQEPLSAKEPLFLSISTFRVDEKNNIYVLDKKARKLLMFNKDLTLEYSVGSSGRGPGEMLLPSQIELGFDNKILVFDLGNRKILYFDRKTGDMTEEISTARFSRILRIDDSEDGMFFALIANYDEKGRSLLLNKLDRQLNQVQTLLSISDKISQKIEAFQETIFFRLISKDRILFGKSGEFSFHIADIGGNVINTFSVDYRPINFSESDKLNFLEAYRNRPEVPEFLFPENFPPINYVITDGENRILVKTYEKVNNSYYYQLFSLYGDPIGRFASNLDFHCIQADMLWSLEEDESGLQRICGYKFSLTEK